MLIDWKSSLADYSGRWRQNFTSIMNPNGSKITFIQYLAEIICWNRMQVLKSYSDVKIGPQWYSTIQKDVRSLNQQAAALTGYFPFYEDEPLVVPAFKNFFRKHRTLAIGGFKKNRVTKKGTIAISQEEKDCIIGISTELDRLIKQREIFKVTGNKLAEKPIQVIEKLSIIETPPMRGKSMTSLEKLMKIEQEIKDQ